ncbi:membrane-spanning 4-domains subfamily A member 4A-like isoform X3 [Crotalus tigris]|uniref:membrane-spanning 4-domains subfamily A member 4A-like isoform X3 n=1 Tax=Crotalus tigris TaxID=88082 RepID=UPI00192F30FA|nr:membrane-spanning 4-domains subfamily A member 4A-like isoform X3 [Crotalus tigris]
MTRTSQLSLPSSSLTGPRKCWEIVTRTVQPYKCVLILAGILTLAADKAKSLNLVKACLVIYVICIVVVAVVNIFYLIDLFYNPRIQYIRCDPRDDFCQLRHQIAACCTAMRGIVLVLTSLGFFVCISMAAFGCKAVCRQNTSVD